ncbi:EamA family transporter [Acidomonas methanolica]|uniref:Transporter EamA n=1 Tax=Acidomonas methanolica NBRC 104435 TaxID=1231351 RepID=A0A023D2P3_ACIMT|nr:EamA family transporter [Acidomonas methanolica]MBU2654805.1 EamA family transporter [Acidomonas methanolica]TCS26469.1 inner membrane transporter RhtA [Acidomonas methanolica]GAJ28428.1 transporter EamA [Acidomonas methanolica NBRC 104435]GBQ45405.1 transporter EamA [Acidomonas methanolica]GEK99217.1 threonine transporter RhtB [Acidomonas methanolica NBRC 104435]
MSVSSGSAGESAGTPRLGHAGAVLFLIGGISSFQIGAVLAKGLFPFFGAAGMVGLRVGLAAIILVLVLRPKAAISQPGAWRRLLPYGASIAMMNSFFYLALERLPLGLTVALEFMGPLTLALAGSRRILDLLWAALVATGVYLLLRPEGGLPPLDPVGVVFALISGSGWVVYILTGTRIGRSMAATEATALGMAVAGLILSPLLLAAVPVAFRHPVQGGEAVCVAILSSAVPYLLDMMAMRRLKPRDMGILLSMEPMLGALSGLILLGEVLSVSRWAGVGCIVAASAGNVLASRRTTAMETQLPPN